MTAWHILTCLSQRERVIAGEISRGLGLNTYMPMEVQRRTVRNVAHELRRPLMPGYVFVGSAGDMPWSDIRATRHVLGWLDIDGVPARLSDAEVDRIREMVQQHNLAVQDKRTFRAGDRVRPTTGPFASMEVLLRSVRGSQAIIEVHMLGSSREARITLDQLEKVA